MKRRVDDEGRLIVDWDDVSAAARRGGRPTADDVTLMSDGRRIDTADMLRVIIAEFAQRQRVDTISAAAVER